MNKSYIVIKDHDDMRIDKWIKKNIETIPQSLIEKLLRLGKIKVANKKVKSSFKVKTGNKINTYNLNFKNFNKKFIYNPSYKDLILNEKEIIFHNDDYLVINKKAGLSVQGGTKSRKNLVDIYSKSKFFSDTKPYTVHRIDKDTSGILIFAKNRKSAQIFTSLFRLRKIHKTYLAICHGEMSQKKGEWSSQLVKYEGKKKITEKAITKFKVLSSNSRFSYVEFKPITGRKHQLRKQSMNSGHCIVGDNKYSIYKKNNKHLMLHAVNIKFMINNKKLSYDAAIPEYFQSFLNSNYLNY